MSNYLYDFSLCIPQSKKTLNDRFLLLKHTNTYFEEMKELFRKAQTKQFGKVENLKLKSILDDPQLQFTEIEVGLLFAYSLSGRLCDLGPEIQNMLRISNDFPPKSKEENDKKFREQLAIDLAKFDVFLPMLRVKLVVYEIAYLITNDENYLIYLLGITDRYLSCPLIIRKITLNKSFSIYSKDIKEKAKAKKFINNVLKTIKGNTKSKKRTLPYWRNYYYYFEVMSCIESSFKIKDKKDLLGYIKTFSYCWGIPSEFIDLIYNRTDSHTNLTLQIMEERKMIKDGEQFLKGYNKHIKEIRNKNMEIVFLPESFFSILDIIAIEPLFFTKFDPFDKLSSFNRL